MSYSSINSYKSAISQTLALIGNKTFLNNSLIVRCMKGIFNLRPPVPRYTFTWDVKKVLTFLSSLFPLTTISLKMITLKLAALLALSTAQRAQTLVSLSITNLRLSSRNASFTVNSLQKTSKVGCLNQTVEIKSYEKQELCPVCTLKHYIKITQKLRKSNKLLISFKTFKNISTSTLARWLKNILQLSGIDITKFKAHSYRGASTSAAYISGISLKEVLKTANWRSAKTFKKFYLRNIDNEASSNCQSNDFIQRAFSHEAN